jgi:hypothetical protein
VESISELLAERCPSFFSEADKVRYQALELLNRAKVSENPEERERYLKNSLDVCVLTHHHLLNLIITITSFKFFSSVHFSIFVMTDVPSYSRPR